jgi:xanthine dehydrogenase YagS FAD-binding subunit
MTNFEYACPTTEQEAIEMLVEAGDTAAVLAAGTDLVTLLKTDVVQPQRVVDITRIDSLRGIEATPAGVVIGALTTLEEISESAVLAEYPSLLDVVSGIRALQIQQNGTIGGDLCHLPNCWYFRKGYGLLARDNGSSLSEQGDNRYHAIFGNSGPAKFVSASRFAPGLIAWDAEVRIAGPRPEDADWIALEDFYTTPRTDRHGVSILKPGQFITHVRLREPEQTLSATYEVLEMQGLDWPLAAAACTLDLDANGLVRRAKIVLGHVAPTPWVSDLAVSELIGKPVTPETATAAGHAAITEATPLKDNEYKVQLAQTSVKRALLRATSQL